MKNQRIIRTVTLVMLIAAMMLSLTACKSEETKNVEDMIDELGTISLESESAISAAEAAYRALSEEDQADVDNISTLLSARDKHNVLIIDSVEDAIEFIGAVSLDSNDPIAAAWELYDTLPNDLKNQVDNFDVLEAATDELAQAVMKQIKDVKLMTPEEAADILKNYSIPNKDLAELKASVEGMLLCSGTFSQDEEYDATVTFYIQYGEYWMEIDYEGYIGFISESKIQVDGEDGFLFKTETDGGHFNPFTDEYMDTYFTIRFGENKLYITWGLSSYYLSRPE